MASFDHRKADLRAQLATWKTLMKPSEWDPIARSLEAYLTLRDEALTALIAVVADDGTERLRSRYESTLDSYAGRISNTLGGMLSGLTDVSEGARLFREQTMVQECGFFNSLGAPDPCRTRDALVTLEADLAKMITDLDAKWYALQGNSRRVLDTELEATRAMNQLFDDTIRSIAPLHERIGVLLATMIEHVAGFGDKVNSEIVKRATAYGDTNPGSAVNFDSASDAVEISRIGAGLFATAKTLGITAAAVSKAMPFLVRDPGMFVTDTMTSVLPGDGQILVSVLGEMRKGLVYKLIEPYAARRSAVQDALPFQGTIIVSFSETRADVTNFLAKNGIDTAGKLKELSDADFEHWVSAQGVAGNHDDAVDIKVAMQTPLQARFDRMLRRLQDFVSNYTGIFLGTLDSRTRRLLLDPEEWDRQMAGMEGYALDQRLVAWHDNVLTINSKLTDIWGKLQDQLSGLPIDIQGPLMDRVRSIWEPLAASIREAASGAVVDLEQDVRVVGNDQRHRDLDRSAVMAKLAQ